MEADRDAVDVARAHLARLHPDLDTRALGVVGRILRLAAALEGRRAAHLAALDLAVGDYDVLATLRRTEGESGVNPHTLLRSVLITSGGLTKRLDRLERAGLLRRHPDPDDRRGTLVRLTPAGSALADRAITMLLHAEREAIAGVLTDDEVDQAAGLLRRLGGMAEA